VSDEAAQPSDPARDSDAVVIDVGSDDSGALDVLPPVERLEPEKTVYPVLPPEEEVAISGEDGAIILERTLPAELKLMFGALFPMALFWSWVSGQAAAGSALQALDGWVFGELSVAGTMAAIAALPWVLLALGWAKARRHHGRCTLHGDLAILEAPLGLGRLGRMAVARADVVTWKESPVGFHLELRGEPLWLQWLFPRFMPGWSPRRRAAARAWLDGSGEIEPLRHLAHHPGWGRFVLFPALFLGVLVLPQVGLRVRYETSPAWGDARYPAVQTLFNLSLLASCLGGGLLLAPELRRRRRVALFEGHLVMGETLVPVASLRRVALAGGRLAVEADGRRWVVEVPASPAAADALRELLPAGVTLDGALPGWARGRVRLAVGGACLLGVFGLALGNPPIHASRTYLDTTGQQLHVVYRVSDRRPVFMAVQTTDDPGASTPRHALRVAQSGLGGGLRPGWAGDAERVDVDLDEGALTVSAGEAQVLDPSTTVVVWRPGEPPSQAALELDPDLVRHLDGVAPPLLATPFMSETSAGTLPGLWTVADILALLADWEGTALASFAGGETGARTHIVEDTGHQMLWRARGDELQFLTVVPLREAGQLELDYRGVPIFAGRLLPRCARVRFSSVASNAFEVIEAPLPRVDSAAVATDLVRSGRPIIEATRELLAPFWLDGR
jgi:hypothetical protein